MPIDKKIKRKECAVCEKEFTPFRTTQTVCSNKCAIKLAESKRKDKQRQTESWVYEKDNRQVLQGLMQKLARMIDARFGFNTCIDCDRLFGKQIDGGHFHSKGHNASIALNLHNIHSQDSPCNGFHGGKQMQYYEGLIKRYGQDYADYVKYELQKKYPSIHLMHFEIPDKIKIVRKLIRNFEAYSFLNSIHARDVCNTIVGIYK